MKPEAVIFDCDGVLVDSEPVTLAQVREDFAGYGLSLTPGETADLFIGKTIGACGDYARGRGAPIPEDWETAFYDRLCARLARGTELMPGVEALLARLDAAGVPYGVGSNGQIRKMEATLGQHPEVWKRFQGKLFSGVEMPRPKPAPDLYLKVAEVLGAAPRHCVVVEDTPTGARAGIAAGMRVMGYAPAGPGAELAAVGAEPFHNMADLPALLGL